MALVHKIDRIDKKGINSVFIRVEIQQQSGTYHSLTLRLRVGTTCDYDCVYTPTAPSSGSTPDSFIYNFPIGCNEIRVHSETNTIPVQPFTAQKINKITNVYIGVGDTFNEAVAEALIGKEDTYKIEIIESGNVSIGNEQKKYVVIKHKQKNKNI